MRNYIPYRFDFKFQYKTYKNIGISYRIEFNAKKKFLYKMRRIVRNVLNKNEKKYKNFDTFSQWEHYICEEFDAKKFANQKDFIRYLKCRKRNAEIFCDMIGTVVTPIYVVMLTMGATVLMNTDNINDSNMIKAGIIHGFIFMSIILVIVLFCLMVYFFGKRRKKYFFKDLIIVLEKGHTNH